MTDFNGKLEKLIQRIEKIDENIEVLLRQIESAQKKKDDETRLLNERHTVFLWASISVSVAMIVVAITLVVGVLLLVI